MKQRQLEEQKTQPSIQSTHKTVNNEEDSNPKSNGHQRKDSAELYLEQSKRISTDGSRRLERKSSSPPNLETCSLNINNEQEELTSPIRKDQKPINPKLFNEQMKQWMDSDKLKLAKSKKSNQQLTQLAQQLHNSKRNTNEQQQHNQQQLSDHRPKMHSIDELLTTNDKLSSKPKRQRYKSKEFASPLHGRKQIFAEEKLQQYQDKQTGFKTSTKSPQMNNMSQIGQSQNKGLLKKLIQNATNFLKKSKMPSTDFDGQKLSNLKEFQIYFSQIEQTHIFDTFFKSLLTANEIKQQKKKYYQRSSSFEKQSDKPNNLFNKIKKEALFKTINVKLSQQTNQVLQSPKMKTKSSKKRQKIVNKLYDNKYMNKSETQNFIINLESNEK